MSYICFLAELPVEVLLDNVLPYVDVPGLLNLGRTSKVWECLLCF